MSEFNDLLTSWRRDLHQHPEYALTETYTPAFIAQRLREMGVEFEEHVGKTGIVATIKNGTGKKVVGLRADFDGILLQEQNTFSYRSKNDGLMHGCGHDGHTACLARRGQAALGKQGFRRHHPLCVPAGRGARKGRARDD